MRIGELRRIGRALRVLLAALTAGALGCSECERDRDCGEGLVCTAGACVEPPAPAPPPPPVPRLDVGPRDLGGPVDAGDVGPIDAGDAGAGDAGAGDAGDAGAGDAGDAGTPLVGPLRGRVWHRELRIAGGETTESGALFQDLGALQVTVEREVFGGLVAQGGTCLLFTLDTDGPPAPVPAHDVILRAAAPGGSMLTLSPTAEGRLAPGAPPSAPFLAPMQALEIMIQGAASGLAAAVAQVESPGARLFANPIASQLDLRAPITFVWTVGPTSGFVYLVAEVSGPERPEVVLDCTIVDDGLFTLPLGAADAFEAARAGRPATLRLVRRTLTMRQVALQPGGTIDVALELEVGFRWDLP